MTQEEKDSLLADLCGRLPYKPMVEYKSETYNVLGITQGRLVLCKPFMSYTLDEYPFVEEVKPCLFPLSSMTEEQKSYLHFNTRFEVDMFGKLVVKMDSDDNYLYTDISDYTSIINWLIENKFDYRGLTPLGLTLDATGLNIY